MAPCCTAYGALTRLSKVALLASATFLAAGMAQAEEITIAALGDSLTQGYGLLPQDGFVPQLEAWLEARGHDVAIINAGVSGDTTAGGLARVEWTLTDRVDAMIVALGGNDLLRGLPPESSRANLEGILQAAEVPVLLAGLQAPGNYGPEYEAAFNAMYPELAEQYGAIHVDSFLGGIREASEDEASAISVYMQADGIHPNALGVAANVEYIGPQVETLIARVSQP